MSLNYQEIFAIHVYIVAVFMLVQGIVTLLCWNDIHYYEKGVIINFSILFLEC